MLLSRSESNRGTKESSRSKEKGGRETRIENARNVIMNSVLAARAIGKKSAERPRPAVQVKTKLLSGIQLRFWCPVAKEKDNEASNLPTPRAFGQSTGRVECRI